MLLGGFGLLHNNLPLDEIALSSDSIKLLSDSFKAFLYEDTKTKLLLATSGAFLGTFFATLISKLFRILESITSRIYKRDLKHFDTLIFFEALLNDYLGIIHDNIYLIKAFGPSVKQGGINWSLPRTLKIEKQRLSNLLSINLINNLNEYFLNLRKLNDDIIAINRGYNDLKNAYINKKIAPDHYVENSLRITKELNLLRIFSNLQQDKTIELLAEIRLFIRRDRSILTKIIHRFIDKDKEKFEDKLIKKEITKLKKEVKESGDRSKVELTLAQNKYSSE